MLRDDGEPRRRKGGGIVRSSREFVPNDAARYVPFMSDHDLARMIGFDGDNRDHRYKARKAFERLDADNVVELARDRGGVRLFGPRRR